MSLKNSTEWIKMSNKGEINNNHDKEKHNLIRIIIIYAFWVIVLLLLSYWIINNDCPSKAGNDGWASYFGSFWGGVLGGGATLVAVVYTINDNKRENERKSKEAKEEKIKKSALIIYYDFDFAFKDIKMFMRDYVNRTKYRPGEDLKKCDHEKFKKSMNQLKQFYFDSTWIHTVAELYDVNISKSKKIDSEKIKRIYAIYGHFMTINKSIESPENFELCRRALDSMNQIVKATSENENFSIILNDQDLIDDLKEIAELG